MTNDIAVRDAGDSPMTIQQLTGQVHLIQDVMRAVMKDGEHYGVIPGCGTKPALLKAGAEKLGMTFHLAPQFEVKQTDHPGNHREYQVICTLNGRHQGVGSCSSMEGKYRFRTGPKKSTEQPVPKEYWDLRASNPAKAQAFLGGKGFTTSKEDGVWMICEMGEKVEHDNPADYYNTVLKMAKKRAHVDAILTATAASDIFTQDIEEMAENTSVANATASPTTAQTTPKPPPAPERRQEGPKAAQSAPSQPQGDPQAELHQRPLPAGTQTVSGIVEAVSKKAGTSKKGPFNKYGVKVAGVWFNTFSDSDGGLAEQAKAGGAQIMIYFTTDQYGNQIERIERAGEVPKEPAATEPANDDNDIPF